MKAGDRVKWLVQEKGMKDADAVNVVMTEFGSVFSAAWLQIHSRRHNSKILILCKPIFE